MQRVGCMCHDQGRAEDAVQEGFLGLWRGRMRTEEIASTLSLPPGTVKGRMRLGLAKLHEDPQIPA